MISIFSYINRIVYCFDFRLDAIDSIDSMERNEFLFFLLVDLIFSAKIVYLYTQVREESKNHV